jgi:hypothetical protein
MANEFIGQSHCQNETQVKLHAVTVGHTSVLSFQAALIYIIFGLRCRQKKDIPTKMAAT